MIHQTGDVSLEMAPGGGYIVIGFIRSWNEFSYFETKCPAEAISAYRGMVAVAAILQRGQPR